MKILMQAHGENTDDKRLMCSKVLRRHNGQTGEIICELVVFGVNSIAIRFLVALRASRGF